MLMSNILMSNMLMSNILMSNMLMSNMLCWICLAFYYRERILLQPKFYQNLWLLLTEMSFLGCFTSSKADGFYEFSFSHLTFVPLAEKLTVQSIYSIIIIEIIIFDIRIFDIIYSKFKENFFNDAILIGCVDSAWLLPMAFATIFAKCAHVWL